MLLSIILVAAAFGGGVFVGYYYNNKFTAVVQTAEAVKKDL